MSIITLTSGATFQVKPGTSILDAAAEKSISLPYSCKTGRCSTCKCKVLSGTTSLIHPETGLDEHEVNAGWILSCVRSAVSDLVLEVDDLGGVDLPIVKTLPCRITQISHLAPDVVKIILRLPPTAEFRYLPGQYVELIGQNGIRRSYSLANSISENKTLELHIRKVPDGIMSEYWFSQAKVNDLLRLNGPLGTFFLRDTKGKDLIFLATGTGIAPIKAILESMQGLSSELSPRSVTVLWGGRLPQDIYLNIAEMPGNPVFTPVLSRPDGDWVGARGYIQNVFLETNPDLKNAVVYACGSDTMIHSARVSLVKAGLSPKDFYSDAFVSSNTNNLS